MANINEAKSVLKAQNKVWDLGATVRYFVQRTFKTDLKDGGNVKETNGGICKHLGIHTCLMQFIRRLVNEHAT